MPICKYGRIVSIVPWILFIVIVYLKMKILFFYVQIKNKYSIRINCINNFLNLFLQPIVYSEI